LLTPVTVFARAQALLDEQVKVHLAEQFEATDGGSERTPWLLHVDAQVAPVVAHENTALGNKGLRY
jgi:hypothetical protein